MIKDLYSNRNIAHTLIFVHHSVFPSRHQQTNNFSTLQSFPLNPSISLPRPCSSLLKPL